MIEVKTNGAYLSGKEDGKQVWKLIKDEIDYNKQNTIVFPDGLSYMTETFLNGFLDEPLRNKVDVKKIIKFKCGNAYIKSLINYYWSKYDN